MMKLFFLTLFFVSSLSAAQPNADAARLAQLYADDAVRPISQIVKNALTAAPSEVVNIFSQRLAESIRDVFAREYQRKFTPDELRQLAELLNSPLGQKFRAANTEMALSMATDPTWLQQVRGTACANTRKTLTTDQMAPLLATFCK